MYKIKNISGKNKKTTTYKKKYGITHIILSMCDIIHIKSLMTIILLIMHYTMKIDCYNIHMI